MAGERRKSERFDIGRDYYYYPTNREKMRACTLLNISATGACIVSQEPLKNEAVIFLHIASSRDIVLKSRVVWQHEGQYGLQFFLDTGEDFENISFILNNELRRINK